MKHYYKTLKTLFQIAPGKRAYVVQQFISSTLAQLITLLPPIATSGIIAVVTEGNFNGIWFYVFLYCIFYLFYFVTLAWDMHSFTVLADYYHNYVQQRLIEHVAENDSIFDEISQGHLSDTISEDIRWLVNIVDVASQAFAGFVQLIVIFVIFAYHNIFIALLALAIDIVYMVLMNDNSHSAAKAYDGIRRTEDKVIDIINQMLSNLKQVKSLNMVGNLTKKLDRTKANWKDQYEKKRQALITRNCVMPSIIYGGKILIYIYLAYLVVMGHITIDVLVLLASYFELVITCTDMILNNLLELSNYGVRIRRIKSIFDYTKDNELDYGDLDNDNIEGSVSFSHVFYEIDDTTILNNVSFKAFPREITTLIGPPGSGKTTVINLLYRLIHVKSGSILIDDESIYNYSKEVYGSNVSGVFQYPFVFKMSIRDNLALADPDKKHQEAACRRVGMHKVIQDLPNGYNTVLDEDHPILTSGQIQKLAIARALLTKAEILLFDEVTSVVDPESVNEIALILTDLKKDHTIIVTTHQPALIKIADKVVRLEEGKVKRERE